MSDWSVHSALSSWFKECFTMKQPATSLDGGPLYCSVCIHGLMSSRWWSACWVGAFCPRYWTCWWKTRPSRRLDLFWIFIFIWDGFLSIRLVAPTCNVNRKYLSLWARNSVQRQKKGFKDFLKLSLSVLPWFRECLVLWWWKWLKCFSNVATIPIFSFRVLHLRGTECCYLLWALSTHFSSVNDILIIHHGVILLTSSCVGSFWMMCTFFFLWLEFHPNN